MGIGYMGKGKSAQLRKRKKNEEKRHLSEYFPIISMLILALVAFISQVLILQNPLLLISLIPLLGFAYYFYNVPKNTKRGEANIRYEKEN